LINDLAKPIWRWTPALCQEERQQVLQAREKLKKKNSDAVDCDDKPAKPRLDAVRLICSNCVV
jgi:hypothetical protein